MHTIGAGDDHKMLGGSTKMSGGSKHSSVMEISKLVLPTETEVIPPELFSSTSCSNEAVEKP